MTKLMSSFWIKELYFACSLYLLHVSSMPPGASRLSFLAKKRLYLHMSKRKTHKLLDSSMLRLLLLLNPFQACRNFCFLNIPAMGHRTQHPVNCGCTSLIWDDTNNHRCTGMFNINTININV